MENKTKPRPSVRIVVINDPVSTKEDVAVHAVGCKGIRADTRNTFMSPVVHWTENTTLTPEEWIEDYNADFVAESGPEGAWPIKVHSCARKVMNKS